MDFITVLSGVFVLIGVALLFWTARLLAKKCYFLRDSLITSGEIIGFIEIPNGHEKSYFPKVKFRIEGEREITFQSAMGSGNPSQKIGDKVIVRYSQNQPANAEIDSFFALWGLVLTVGLLGATFSFIGLGILIGWLPV